MKKWTMKDTKFGLTLLIYTMLEIIVAFTISDAAFDLFLEGYREVPQDVKKIHNFVKNFVMTVILQMKKIRDKVMGYRRPMEEKEIVLSKDDEESLKDIEKEVSEL